jgi:hypothetical protein
VVPKEHLIALPNPAVLAGFGNPLDNAQAVLFLSEFGGKFGLFAEHRVILILDGVFAAFSPEQPNNGGPLLPLLNHCVKQTAVLFERPAKFGFTGIEMV